MRASLTAPRRPNDQVRSTNIRWVGAQAQPLERLSGCQSLSFSVVVPDPAACLWHRSEQRVARPEIAPGRLVEGPIEARHALNAGGAFSPELLVDQERPWSYHSIGMAQDGREGNCILNRLIGSLPRVGQHWVGGVSKQGQTPARPGLKRFAIEEPPSKCCLHLSDDSFNQRVPARELSRERACIADGRPGFFQRLVRCNETHVVDELVGPHRKDQKMLAGAKPVAHRTL